MNQSNRFRIQELKLGALDMTETGEGGERQKTPFHEIFISGFAWPVIVNQPCLYVEKGNAGKSIVVLCWKDTNKEQREFITEISIEDFYQRNPLLMKVLYIGPYTDFISLFRDYPVSSSKNFRDGDMVVYGQSGTINLLCQIAKPTNNIYPEKFYRKQ